MKALCLQLSIVVCVILSTQNLSAQLTITCPDGTPQPLTCIEDVPPLVGDSIGFLSLEGASISGVTGKLNIDYSDFTNPDQTGCPGDAISRIRIFRFTDDSDADEIMCNIRYSIMREEDGDSISCENVTVVLDENGSATLDPAFVPFAPFLSCPNDDITITGLEITEFFCNNTIDSPIDNILYAENACGEEIECAFQVTVRDDIDPEITCPDNILVDLDPCVCESQIFFDDAQATDECGINGNVEVTRIDDTGLNSGDLIPEGLTILTFQAEDQSGNTAMCNLQIRVRSGDPGSLFCKVDQNISLDQTCSAKVTPQMMVKEPNCDIDSYVVTLFDQNGNQLPSDTITAEYLGQVITAHAAYECYDNYCTVNFNVEDKMPPMVTCGNMTVSCTEFIDFPLPTISDNCGTFTPVLLNQVPVDVACDSVDIDKIITRTYGVRDESGEIVETCEQVISIMKFDISEVEGPELIVQLACDSMTTLDENGNPDPSITGAPSLNGIDLFPPEELYCNVALSYDDMVFPDNGCGKSLLRTWTVMNWYCGEDGMVTFKQSIMIIDTVGPEIIAPDSITISSSMTSCITEYTIPMPVLNDNCQDDIQLDIIYPGGIAFDTNSVTVNLELGDNTITYRANDRCGNFTTAAYVVTVEDMVEPVAICESGLSFSLDGNGMAILTAKTFDNGSLDECSDAVLEIARMADNCGVEGNTEFGSSVVLCCEDIGQDVMIMLRVSDSAGNSNQCMASIQVVDETVPSFSSALPDITISNDYPIDTSNLTPFGIVEQNVYFPGEINLDADSVNFSGPNVNAVVMDNCSVNTVIESKVANINMCQTGTIVRTFIVTDASGTEDTIEQTITVIAQSEFTRDDITFPEDTVIMDVCSPDLNALKLESHPEYDDSFSTMVSHTSEDDTLAYFSDGCFTVERIWYVSDWCNRPDGLTFATFIDTQMITVVDNIDPEITSMCQDSTICSYISACGPHPVNISASASDNCTTEDSLEWTFTIQFADDRPDSLGVGNNFDGTLPVGVNTVTWTVNDGCGNIDQCSFDFTIESCLNPQPVCRIGEEFFISVIDTSDNGMDDPDVNGVRVTPDMIDGGSSHPCNKDFTLSFSEDVNDTVRIFTCDTVGTVPMMLYVTDSDGRFDFCNVNIAVRDTTSEMLCGPAMVAGVVFGNDINFVKGVSVSLEGAALQTETDENGFFAFPEMQSGGSYSVVPTKVDHAQNGVSTADLVLIQRHILAIESFESPYKQIAADVNQSGRISASDLITVRKLLLGLIDEFPSGKTWCFIPGNHIFMDQADPWASPVPEKYDIYKLSGHNEIDFIGVKLGDVNESLVLNEYESTIRNTQSIDIELSDNRIELFASEDMDFAALLANVTLDPYELILESLENHIGGLVMNHAITEKGELRLLFNSPENVKIKKGTMLASIVVNRNLVPGDLGSIFFDNERSEIAYENGSSSGVTFRTVSEIPGLVMRQNVPNPWVSSTSFTVTTPSTESAIYRILDVSGKLVFSKNIQLVKGENTIEVEAHELPAGGVYMYEISTPTSLASKKMMLLDR